MPLISLRYNKVVFSRGGQRGMRGALNPTSTGPATTVSVTEPQM